MKTKIFFRYAKLTIVLYCSLGILLYYLQGKILFHPQPFPAKESFNISAPHVEVNIPYNKDTRLNIVEFKTDSAAKGVVLYFHGNRNNILWYAKNSNNFTKNNYEVWMLDYPGFGKSTGVFSERDLYRYALLEYTLARARFSPDRIILYGKSFGTCLATQPASVRDCKFLVLETPCYSLSSLVAHYVPIYPVNQMLHYHFPNNEYLREFTAPVLIFQGTADGVVPYSNAVRLTEDLKTHDEFVTIPGGSHNNLSDFALFHQKLDSLLR